MIPTTTGERGEQLSRRDLAVLRAVAAGQCELVGDCGPVLIIDGRCCSDQLAARRLTASGLIDPPADRGRARAQLTATGHALLAAA